MSRFDGGWVKVYRELLETDIANNPTRLSLFVHLIAMANVEDSWVEFASKPRVCPRGSLVTSHRELSSKIGAGRGSVERQLKYLAMRDTLSIETEARGTFITIKNYSDYQDVNATPVTKSSQRRGADEATGEAKDRASNEELRNKELKNKEVYISTEPKNSVAVVKSKKETVEFKLSDSKTIHVTKELIDSWIDTFPKEFLDEEIKKARSWVLSNPHKSPKSNWGRFLNSWFNRGWDRYRQTLKSNPTKITLDDLNEALGRL